MSGVTFYSLACPTCRDVIVGSVDPGVPAGQLDLSCPACWGETENLPDFTRSGLCPLCLQRTLQVMCGTCVD